MKKGRASHSSLFIVCSSAGNPDTRVAATASKKVSKTAVGRNHSRRMIYEAVRPIFNSIRPGIHAIVFAKSGTDRLLFSELKKEISSLFAKAGLLK